jgi:plastocyanin
VPAPASVAIGMKADVEQALTAQNDQWAASTLSVGAGKVVHLTVTNKDAGDHVFDQDDLHVKIDLPAGATRDVWLKFDAPGAYQWYCEIHSTKGADGKWSGMVGTITVA